MLVEHTTDFALLYFPIHRYFVYSEGRQTGESEHITTIAIIIIKIVCTCPPLSFLFHAVVTLTLSTFDMK